MVGGFGEFFEFFAAAGIEEFELFSAVREAGEGDAEEADFALGVDRVASIQKPRRYLARAGKEDRSCSKRILRVLDAGRRCEEGLGSSR